MSSTPGFADLVGDGGLILDADYGSKDALLAGLAAAAALVTGLAAPLILERLRTREALGSTGFGQGAAIPHARIEGLAGVTVLLARLVQGVDYGALDGDPVDVAVLLLSPEGAGADHLKALARISRVLRDPSALARIRDAGDVDALRIAIGPPVSGSVGQRAA
jgi:PTS system nitrogen regulatory IIA component